LSPLLELLDREDPIGSEAALRVLQAIRTFNIKRDELWIEALEGMSKHLQKEFALELALLLTEIVERNVSKKDNDSIIFACGKTGRNILSWTWELRRESKQTWIHKLGGVFAVPVVAKHSGQT